MNNLFVPKDSEEHLNKLKRDNYLVLSSGTHLFAISQKQESKVGMMLPCATDPQKKEHTITSIAATEKDLFYTFENNLIKFQKAGWTSDEPIHSLNTCEEGLIYVNKEKAFVLKETGETFTLKLPRPVKEVVVFSTDSEEGDIFYTSDDRLYNYLGEGKISEKISFNPYKNLCVNGNKLYGTIDNKIYDVISEEKIVEREGEVTALGSHKDKLHDLGDYEFLYETHSGKEIFKFLMEDVDGEKYVKNGIVSVPHSIIGEYINE